MPFFNPCFLNTTFYYPFELIPTPWRVKNCSSYMLHQHWGKLGGKCSFRHWFHPNDVGPELDLGDLSIPHPQAGSGCFACAQLFRTTVFTSSVIAVGCQPYSQAMQPRYHNPHNHCRWASLQNRGGCSRNHRVGSDRS